MFEEILFENQDKKYRDFEAKLNPTIPKDEIIGVRMPVLRKLSNNLWKEENDKCLLLIQDLPHKYYEESIMHGIFIGKLKGFDRTVDALEHYLPTIRSWSESDPLTPGIFKKYPEQIIESGYLEKWLSDEKVYVKRFAMIVLMNCCLKDEVFEERFPEMVIESEEEYLCRQFNMNSASHHEGKKNSKKLNEMPYPSPKEKSDDYYLRMMVAWYFATSIAYQKDIILPYFEVKRLDPWTHRKAIQKCIESYRVDDELCEYLRTLK